MEKEKKLYKEYNKRKKIRSIAITTIKIIRMIITTATATATAARRGDSNMNK